MYKKLKVYYFYTVLPFVLLLIGAIFFRQAIVNTLATNPHPQINYMIFLLIVSGAFLIIANQRKLMNEAEKLSEFSAAVRSGAEPAQLQKMAMGYEADVAYVLRMIASSSGRALPHREQVAIEQELNKFHNRLDNRHTLPQFMTNLLVGMGLLGTFIGLLATLGDIAALVSSFATLDLTTANPIEVFRTMVEKMRAPMYSMGIAFSASLYGLLGSIILGFMMVSIRRCMQDVVSLCGSEVAQHIEFALAREAMNKAPARPEGGGSSGVLLSGKSELALLADAESGQTAGTLSAHWYDEEIRVLRRIEERLSEFSRLQEGALQNELEQFARQRGEFIRAVGEHSSALNQFNSELTRVGNALERGQTDVRADLHDFFSAMVQATNTHGRNLTVANDLMTRMADDSSESRRLTAMLLDRTVANDPQVANAELAKVLQLAFQKAVQELLQRPAAGKSGA